MAGRKSWVVWQASVILMLDFSRFDFVSFDCYGTLIDWESGILGYLRPLLESKGCALSDAEILTRYSEIEPCQEAGAYRSYREVLAAVVREYARALQFEVSESEANGLAASIRDWQPFADTVVGLQRLRSRYRLSVLSNIDDDLFAASSSKLGKCFDVVITAQEAGSYKPSLNNFRLLLERLAIPPQKLLHVSESFFHDVVPAHSLGITTVWVNRRQGRAAAATRLVAAQPDLEVPNIIRLAELAVPASPGP